MKMAHFYGSYNNDFELYYSMSEPLTQSYFYDTLIIPYHIKIENFRQNYKPDGKEI